MCGAAKKRRTCSNRQSVRQDYARERIFEAIEARFSSQEPVKFLRQAIVTELRRLSSTANAELQEHEERLGRNRQRLEKLVEFIADGNTSPTIASTINDLEAQAESEKAAIAAIRARASQPTLLPSPDAILVGGLRLRETLEGDPIVAREQLRRLFRGEGITMKPLDDGTYLAQGKFFPLLALTDAKTTKEQCPEGVPSRHSLSSGCAGRIPSVDHEPCTPAF